MNKLKFEFTTDQLAILSAALNEIPYKFAAPLIQEINTQIQAQQISVVEG